MGDSIRFTIGGQLGPSYRSTLSHAVTEARKASQMIQGGFAAIGLGSFASFENSIYQMGKSLRENADRLGVSTDEVQALNYAAEEAGSSLDHVATALDRLAKSKETALSGSKEGAKLAETFQDFGLSIQQVRDKSPKELFDSLGASINRTGVNAQVTADLMALIGRNAGALIPTLKGLADNYAQFEHSPLRLSESDIATIDKAGHAWNRLFTGIKVGAAGAQIGLMALFKSDTWASLLYPKIADNPQDYFRLEEMRDKLAVQKLVNAPLPDYTVKGDESAPQKRKSGAGMAEVAALGQQLAEKVLAIKMRQMNRPDQIKALKNQIQTHEANADFYASIGETADDILAGKERLKAADLREKLSELENKKATPKQLTQTEWERAGFFQGGNVPIHDTLKRSLHVQERIEQHIATHRGSGNGRGRGVDYGDGPR